MARFIISFIGQKALGKGHITIEAGDIEEAIRIAWKSIQIKEITSVSKLHEYKNGA